MKIYMIGIKGTGMTALAVYLKGRGYTVEGSDVDEYFFTEEELNKNNICYKSFSKNNIKNDCLYIIGNAFNKENNEEVKEIISKGLKYKYYHEFIGTLNHKIIGVAGTHGKTSTSSIIVQMLNNNCSYIIGDGEGYYSSNSRYLVLESCEYKNHFHSYYPFIGIITNIEMDHMDFFKNKKMLRKSFLVYASHSCNLIYNGDQIKRIKHPHKISYGFEKNNDAVIEIIQETKEGYIISLNSKRRNIYTVPFKGKHQIYNFVAGLLVLEMMNVEYQEKKILLPKRRMKEERYGKSILIDDYAHHPTEVRNVLLALKEMYPEKKINLFIQFHSYNRAINLKKDFINSFNLASNVYIYGIYVPKRESVDNEKENEIDKIYHNYKKSDDEIIKKIGTSEDVYAFLSAGTMYQEIKKILEKQNSD